MQFLILGLLMLERMSLYDLHKQFSAGPALFYSASFGSIQRALRQLVDSGMVTVEEAAGSARRRKLHAVTETGRVAWRAWMHEPVGGANAETAMLAKVFLLGLIPAEEERREVIASLRGSVASALGELQGLGLHLDGQLIAPEHEQIFRFQRVTLEYGLRTHELALAWLDELAGSPPSAPA